MEEKQPINHEINDCSPQILEHYVGQRGVVDRIKVALEASWADGIRFPHTLLTGGAGLGKTELSSIISKEMGCDKLREQLAQNLSCPALLRGFLLEANDKDVLLIDEIHELKKEVQVTLYRALENKRLFLTVQNGRTSTLNLTNFTLIGATTDPHKLLKPLRDRFKLVLPFEYYCPEDIEVLVRQRCKQLGWQVEDSVFSLIAQRGRGTPRIALRLMESAKRIARSENAIEITAEHFARMCKLEGLDELGLGSDERKYLKILSESQIPMRLNVIATRLGMHPKTVSEVIENFLVQTGLVNKDDKGRSLTPMGLAHIRSHGV